MADIWPEFRLAELCNSIDYGYTASASSTSVGPRFLRITDIVNGPIDWKTVPFCKIDDDSLEKYHLYNGDIVIARTGATTGVSAYISEPPTAVFASYLVRLKIGTRADARFISYSLKSNIFWAYIRGVLGDKSAQPNASAKTMTQVKLRIPPLPEQRAIAHILGTLDDKIELNRKMNETLEAMAQAIFKSWFVDFEPFRDQGMEDSTLGPIPRGWRVSKLSDLCKTQYGYTASATEEPVGPHLLRVTDINKQNWIEWTSVPYCRISDEDKTKYALELGDLVVARMADPGKSAIIEQTINAIFASYLVRLKTESLAHAYYVYGFLKSRTYADYAEGAGGGSSVQKTMNAKMIVDVNLFIPPLPTLEVFLKRVLPLRRRLVNNVEQSTTLAAIRNALLPKLLSGEIRVKDAERFAERAA